MWVVVRTTPSTLSMPEVTTSAMCAWSRTRTIAIRSTSPAQEYTSATPSVSARACAVSGMREFCAWIITIAVIMGSL